MSGLVLLVTTWNCWITYKNGYAGLLVLHFLPLLNPLLIVQGVNQKITIAVVRPRLGKRVQGACVPKCSWGFRVGGGFALSPLPQQGSLGDEPPRKNFKALNCIKIGLNWVRTSDSNTYKDYKMSTN